VDELIEHFKIGCNEKKISLHAFYYSRVPELLKGDSQRMKQVLHNILQNSLKFTYSKGQITIAVDYEAQTKLLMIKVSDTGIGIPKAD
jgi:signal transduction histidine kinase